MSSGKIMVVEDDATLSEALSETLSLAGYDVTTACDGVDALEKLQDSQFNLVVSDIQMPNMDGHSLLKKIRQKESALPVMLMTAYGSIQQAVDAMHDGAVDYMVKPFEAEVLVNMVSRYIGEPDITTSTMIAEDTESKKTLSLAKKLAQSNITAMITGESGVGKEVLAQYIHTHSDRADLPFVAINCAAIPENMLEATLFGYEKGAYTGAYKACPGKFEQAQGGTLLLDEITEMDLGLQAKLLRVLQEKQVERLGGNKVIELDVRIIATSNRDVLSYVKAGKFREDLYYRINVFPLMILPLWKRKGDVMPLAMSLLKKYSLVAKHAIPKISSAAQELLFKHRWPGNVRELDNVVQRALLLSDENLIDAEHIHFENTTEEPALMSNAESEIAESNVTTIDSSVIQQTSDNVDSNNSLGNDLRKREWTVILDTIKAVRGSRKNAAEKLGISQRTLRYKLAKMRDEGIVIPDRYSVEAV